MKENCGLKGRYEISLISADTGHLLQLIKFDNCLTVIHRDMRCALLLGTTSGYTLNDLSIAAFAFGDGANPAQANNTALQHEMYRKAVTKKALSAINTVQSICAISNTECNFTIREIGVYSSTGKLLSRANCNIEKNSNIVMNVTRYDVINI